MTVRAYVDTRISDLVAADAAALAAASHWDLDDPVLIRHGMNAIYRCADCVLRVATPSVSATVSVELAEVLDGAGIRVPVARRSDVVTVGAMSVTAWPHVVSSGDPIDWSAVGQMVRIVHGLDRGRLPGGVPIPTPTSFPWWDFASMFESVGAHVDDRALVGMRSAIDRHEGWDDFGSADVDGVVICHGDVHPGNVIMTSDGPTLIDWDLLCAAPFGWDHGPMMTWTERWGGPPGLYEAFADGYGETGRGNRHAEAFAELRLVAATLMRVKAGLVNSDAQPEAQRRLAYWRGDPDAPTWRAQ